MISEDGMELAKGDREGGMLMMEVTTVRNGFRGPSERLWRKHL